MADLVQGPRDGLVRRLLLEEEADGAARFAEIGVARMALVARREDGAHRPGIEARDKLGGARLQGVAGVRRQEARQHQKAVTPVSVEVGRHWTTRSMITGLATGGPSSMRIVRRRMAIA